MAADDGARSPRPDEQLFVLAELDVPAAPQEPGAPASDAPPARRRRRPAAASLGPPPALLRAGEHLLRWGPPALLTFAPLAWGGVESWSLLVVVATASALGIVWLLRLALFPERCAAERTALSCTRSWSAELHWPLLAVVAVGLVQVVPSGALGAKLSPLGAELQRQAGIGPGALALSLAPGQTLLALAQFAAAGLLFFAVRDALPGRAEVRRLAAILVVLGFAHAIGGILWHYQGPGRAYWLSGARGSSFGPYVNRNHFAGLMGMTIPLAVGLLLSLGHRRPVGRSTRDSTTSVAGAAGSHAAQSLRPQRFLLGLAVAVMVGALGLSLSRGGIVSTLAALALMAGAIAAQRRTRSHLWRLAAAVVAAAAFAVWLAAGPLLARLGTLGGLFSDESLTAPRTGIWADTLRMAADFPLFGTGFGTFAEVYPRYQTVHPESAVLHAHNDWVQLVAEGGLAGTLAVLFLLGSYFSVAVKLLGRRRDREAIFLGLGGLGGLLAFLLHGLTDFNARIPANAFWCTVLAALSLKALASRREHDA